MAIEEIPVFRSARRGQVVRSSDWNGMQQDLRNSIRTHRHTMIAGDAVDDSSEHDHALQIETAEIADGAVSLVKLDPDVRAAIEDDQLSEQVQQRLDGAAQVTTGDIVLGAGAKETVEHGLGAVPVAIVVGVSQDELLDELELDGEFELYGSVLDRAGVVAAVPREPDGTFTLVAQTDSEVDARWWAFARTADL